MTKQKRNEEVKEKWVTTMVKHNPFPQTEKQNTAVILTTKPQCFQEQNYLTKIFPS